MAYTFTQTITLAIVMDDKWPTERRCQLRLLAFGSDTPTGIVGRDEDEVVRIFAKQLGRGLGTPEGGADGER